MWDAGKRDSRAPATEDRRDLSLAGPQRAPEPKLALSGRQARAQGHGIEPFDPHDLVARLGSAHDADARGRHAGAVGDQAAQGVVGAPVDRRRRHARRVRPVVGGGELLARGARGQADADVGVRGDGAMLVRAQPHPAPLSARAHRNSWPGAPRTRGTFGVRPGAATRHANNACRVWRRMGHKPDKRHRGERQRATADPAPAPLTASFFPSMPWPRGAASASGQQRAATSRSGAARAAAGEARVGRAARAV